jgi:hypothetical protein
LLSYFKSRYFALLCVTLLSLLLYVMLICYVTVCFVTSLTVNNPFLQFCHPPTLHNVTLALHMHESFYTSEQLLFLICSLFNSATKCASLNGKLPILGPLALYCSQCACPVCSGSACHLAVSKRTVLYRSSRSPSLPLAQTRTAFNHLVWRR